MAPMEEKEGEGDGAEYERRIQRMIEPYEKKKRGK